MTNLAENKHVVEKLLTKALPNNDVDYVQKVITPSTVTHRAGFAALYDATGFPIPKDGNFMDWMKNGWSVLHNALSNQKVEMKHIVAEGNQVIAQFHYYATHNDDFAGMPGTGKRVEWDEVGIFNFNEKGKITEMWYMCEEMKLATEIGYKLSK